MNILDARHLASTIEQLGDAIRWVKSSQEAVSNINV